MCRYIFKINSCIIIETNNKSVCIKICLPIKIGISKSHRHETFSIKDFILLNLLFIIISMCNYEFIIKVCCS